MKSFQIVTTMLLGSMAAFAGNPVASTSLNINIPGGSRNGINLEYLKNTGLTEYKSEILFEPGKPAITTISRTLNDGVQIVEVNKCAILINKGDNVQMVLVPKFKDGKPLIGQFSAVFNGKDAARQALPYQIDSLYTVGSNITTVDEMNGLINNAAQQVQALISQAKITNKENLALLKAYEQSKLLREKYLFQFRHPNLLPSKDYANWCLKGFDISLPAYSAIGNWSVMQETVSCWWEQKRMLDSTLSNDLKLATLMKEGKSDVVKGVLAVTNVRIEARLHGLTHKLADMLSLVSNNLPKDLPARKEVDSLLGEYGQLMPGKPAYDFALKNDKGKTIKLSDFKGKVVVIDCWATWCSGCVAALPIYRQIRDSYKDKNDIVFLTIGWEGAGAEEAWKKFSEDHGIGGEYNLLLSLDSEDPQTKQMAKRYVLNTVPRWIVINKDGTFINGNLGHPSGDGFDKVVEGAYQMRSK
ncbi:MAG: TlpA family protein disulfide reductase [Chitinophaga sp.]|uniref:peroxiredoxin family protein n=1 Tax=Chitinophaga sp. TaxID=1869181 RepID=UPI001B2693E5|nr:TlpA disulfide reductase family protein [Chitinophaga sp.]MBO9731568.1 TlpA family protein disulfide reductase [Chitinophaga sp.]